jgi:L-iditol 2-dehydrogenase
MPQGQGWVLVRPALAGICATDLDMLHSLGVPSILSAYGGTSAVIPGHEVVGVVERAAATRWAKEGHRVLVEPTLRCVHKGLAECRRCRAGDTHLCENRDRAGALCSGSAIGSSARAGGGWSEGFLVHEDMLIPADGISDQRGVLAEPAAGALHAVLRWTRRGDHAIVIGSGAQSRLIVATLRRLYPDLEIEVIYDARNPSRPRQGRRARQPSHLNADTASDFNAIRSMGASRVRRGSPEQLLVEVAESLGARALRPEGGGLPVLDGGVDAVFDCQATESSIDLGLRLLRGGGTLVLGGRSGRHLVEWSLVWARELSVLGSALYGREATGHRTFAIVREWLSDPAFPIDAVVTHQFPLEEYKAALETASAGVAAGAVKVVFQGSVAALRTELDAGAAAQDDMNGDAPLLLHANAAHSRSIREARMPR